MPFKPLVTAGIESLLNTFLYRSPALKTARSRLLGQSAARGGKRLFDVIDSGVQRTPG
ncbi:sterol-binding domain-containing protein [Escherichia coli]|uniref:Sterol-binding domain-containing protein n=1 Tax=Escherichia coli TaxID=562 RepID=A0A377DC10_ECOLX|nr:sterol-binding domain-containing protein [Escherichia coli]